MQTASNFILFFPQRKAFLTLLWNREKSKGFEDLTEFEVYWLGDMLTLSDVKDKKTPKGIDTLAKTKV